MLHRLSAFVGRLGLGLALIVVAPSAPVWAQSVQQSLEQQIQDLRQKLEDLDLQLKAERQKEALRDQEAVERAKSQPVIATDNSSGLSVKSPDGDFSIRFGLDFQIDNRTFLGSSTVSLADQILVRRARPTISGTVFKYVDLNPGQNSKRREFLVQFVHHLELLAQPFGVESMGDRQAGTVVGQSPIGVAQLLGRLGHLSNRAAAVRPV